MTNKQEASNKWLILIVVTFGLFMVTLDMSIANLAVSKMMLTFSATLDQIQWVLSAYTLALGVIMPVSAYLSDRFGIKKVFIISLMLFTLGSFLCGIAWNTLFVIAARIIQGIGGGLIIPISMALFMNTFEESERGLAIAVLGIASLMAPAVGPTLGGYIIENLDWRFVFLMNIPVGVIGTILTFLFLKELAHKTLKRIDLIGLMTSSVGLGCALYVLGKGNVDWGDIHNVFLMILGSYSLIMFTVNELLIPEPMLDLKLLRNYTFAICNIVFNIAVLALFGGIFLVPIFLQQLKGLTPFEAGLILFPEAIATAVSMLLASKFSKKLGAKAFIVLALILLAFNSYSLSKISLDTPNSTITILLMIRGLGVGFLTVPIQLAAFNSVPKEFMSNATALMNTVKQIGTSIGITIITSVMQQRNTLNYANLADQVNTFNPNTMNLFQMLQGFLQQSGISQSDSEGGAISLLYGIIAKQSSLQAINDTMLVIAIVSAVTIVPTFFLKESKGQDSDSGSIIIE